MCYNEMFWMSVCFYEILEVNDVTQILPRICLLSSVHISKLNLPWGISTRIGQKYVGLQVSQVRDRLDSEKGWYATTAGHLAELRADMKSSKIEVHFMYV